MGLHRKSGAIDWAEAERQGDIHGRGVAMRTWPAEAECAWCRQTFALLDGDAGGTWPEHSRPVGFDEDRHPGVLGRKRCEGSGARYVPEQIQLLDTTPPPVKRGLDPRNPDGEGWDEAYYGAHIDGGD